MHIFQSNTRKKWLCCGNKNNKNKKRNCLLRVFIFQMMNKWQENRLLGRARNHLHTIIGKNLSPRSSRFIAFLVAFAKNTNFFIKHYKKTMKSEKILAIKALELVAQFKGFSLAEIRNITLQMVGGAHHFQSLNSSLGKF